MDISPPSMVGSPHRRYPSSPSVASYIDCSPQPEAGYPSPVLLDYHCHSQSPFGSVDAGSLHGGFQSASSASHHASATHPLWHTPVRSAPMSSTMSNISTTVYDHFAHYEACLPTTYATGEDCSLPLPTSIGLSRTPSSSTSTTAPISISSRNSLGYLPDHTGHIFRMETPVIYTSGLEPASYTTTAGLHPLRAVDRVLLSSSPQPYGIESPGSSWTKQLDSGSQTSEAGSPPATHRQIPPGRPRRVIRKHTTKEEANFQCQVKGCGKFFSRSYNYKSHLETHDELREYPFPCTVENCTKKFVRKTDLQRHHQSVHTKERNHRCDYCGRLFARKDTLRRHMEDGCSRRFDLGTLDIRAEDFKGIGVLDRTTRAYGGFGPNPEALPSVSQITLPTMHR